jgi:branched-chain amino acid transport system permease protein
MLQLFFEQSLNGLQFGLMLFLLAAGLTLVFGIMDCINLAHGSLYMVGAYFVAAAAQAADSFWIGLGVGVAGTACSGCCSNCRCSASCTGATTCRRSSPPSP